MLQHALPYILAMIGLLLVIRLRHGGNPMNREAVAQRIAAGAQIIDVRSPAEFAGGAYPGAVNIPVNVIEARMAEIDKTMPVVVYCASGGRSGMAEAILNRAGYDALNGGGLSQMPEPQGA